MKRIYVVLTQFGLNPLDFFSSLRFTPIFFLQTIKFIIKKNIHFKKKFFPILGEKYKSGGTTNMYFKLDLIVSQKIFNSKPKSHVDVGSRVDGFVSNIATFMSIDVIDIRKIISPFKEIIFFQADMMKGDFSNKKKYPSVSALHSLEHFGLGRYGDPIDFDGHLKGLENLLKLLKKDGKLYLAVPIGENKIYFNAHRVFSISYLFEIFQDRNLVIHEFDYINDKGDFFLKQNFNDGLDNNFDCKYGCGIFTLMFK
ncbi:DUF268 domain-containing protein [Flavobacteriaceae bacterium]|nr:DUF268 domain-containing protein [Flavobacteriaceae bacterium]